VDWTREELVRASETPPTADAVAAVVAMAAEAPFANRDEVMVLLVELEDWLKKAAALDQTAADFEAAAEVLCEFEMFDILEDFAKGALRRDPANPTARLYALVASSAGEPDNLTKRERRELDELIKGARERRDMPLLKRIDSFLDGEFLPENYVGPGDEEFDDASEDTIPRGVLDKLREMVKSLPEKPAADLLALVRDQGYERALATLMDELRRDPSESAYPPMMLEFIARAILAKAEIESTEKGRKPSDGRKRSFF
jgi:hypothetical protein